MRRRNKLVDRKRGNVITIVSNAYRHLDVPIVNRIHNRYEHVYDIRSYKTSLNPKPKTKQTTTTTNEIINQTTNERLNLYLDIRFMSEFDRKKNPIDTKKWLWPIYN